MNIDAWTHLTHLINTFYLLPTLFFNCVFLAFFGRPCLRGLNSTSSWRCNRLIHLLFFFAALAKPQVEENAQMWEMTVEPYKTHFEAYLFSSTSSSTQIWVWKLTAGRPIDMGLCCRRGSWNAEKNGTKVWQTSQTLRIYGVDMPRGSNESKRSMVSLTQLLHVVPCVPFHSNRLGSWQVFR